MPAPAELDRIASAFAAIALEAGAAIMTVYRSEDVALARKADGSPVSAADERAEEIILRRLAALLPGVAIISEEAVSRHGLPPGAPDRFVLVDPLDGTKEFVQRNGQFTVNIALVEAGRASASVVYAPALERLYLAGGTARAGRVAPGAALDDAGALAAIAARPAPADGLTAVTSRSHGDAETEAFLERLPVIARTSAGSSLKFCLVAEGKADVYPRFGPTMEWDTAAGHGVLCAAGGSVTRPDGAPFRYGKFAEGLRNGPFVAWGRRDR